MYFCNAQLIISPWKTAQYKSAIYYYYYYYYYYLLLLLLLRDWLKRFAPLFHPIRSKTKTNCVIASRALRQQHAITSSFDWFTVLSVFFVIG